MKNIQLIFFFICFIPSILYRSEYDDYIITVKSGITESHCIIDNYGLKKIQFSFYAKTTGLLNSDRLFIPLANPNYAVAVCRPLLSIKKDVLDIITCTIDVANFPLLNEVNTYSIPSHLDSIELDGYSYKVYIENWDELIGKNRNIENKDCFVQNKYTFTQNKNEPIYVKIKKNGSKHLYVKGSLDYDFSKSKKNSICEFKIYAFKDSYFDHFDCQINELDKAENSSDYTLDCDIYGDKKGIFFPTLSTLSSDLNEDYILINIYVEVVLSGAFGKLSSLLLLFLLLF